MLHDPPRRAAANDPQEGLRRLMELFGGLQPFAAILRATPRTRTRLPPILLSVCGATRQPAGYGLGLWCVRPEAAPLTVTGH
ncbi:MAG: hypothetical protein ACLVJ8_16680 [Ruthenibacterium lactatiformans]